MRMKFQMPVIMFALIMLGALTSHAAGQDPKSQIKVEIERLTNSLKEKPIIDPDYAPLSSTASQALQKAAEALDSGNIYLSLEKLLQAEDFLSGARFPLEKTEAVKSGLPAFEAEWKEVSQTITGYDHELRQKNGALHLRRCGPSPKQLLDAPRHYSRVGTVLPFPRRPAKGFSILAKSRGSNFRPIRRFRAASQERCAVPTAVHSSGTSKAPGKDKRGFPAAAFHPTS